MLTNDKQIIITTAGNRRATQWAPQTLYWSELVEKLRLPARGTESLTEYLRLPKGKQDDLKDVGGFVAGTLEGGRRKAGAVRGRDVVTLDLDSIQPGGTAGVLQRIEGLSCAYAVYSTRKHCETNPRLRALFPLSRTATAEEYEAVSRKLASLIGMELCDPSTFEPSRLMYWPSCCSDSQYIYTYADKPFLDTDGMLAMYADWRNVAEWPEVPGVQQTHVKAAERQEDPTLKPGVVGAFCKTYDIYKALELFLPGAYVPCDNYPDRLTFAGGSTTGGAVIYDNGKFLYSHHATDPAGGKLCNAFDLVRLHKYAALDDDTKPDTPANRLPSFTAMFQFASQDANVSTLMTQERYSKATQEFAAEPLPDANYDPNWMTKLVMNPNTGRPALTINNAVTILENDPLLKGKLIFDEFSCRPIVTGALPWNPRTETRWFNNTDAAGVRNYLELVYGIIGKDRIEDATMLAMDKHRFNAVQNYLTALKWDGVKRLDTLFIDYFGAEDMNYTRSVARKSLVAAVARAMIPGVKYDTMPILMGPQGIGKSTFLRYLGKNWFNESLITFEGKEAQEVIQGSWILEIGELAGMTRSEENAVKQFLSKCEDIYRGAYVRLVEKFPRRCVFFGTSNETEVIRDHTGGRRFWPVKLAVTQAIKSVFRDLPGEVDQIWAEAYLCWQLGEPLDLEGEAKEKAKELQETYSESSTKEGIIREFLEKPVPADWEKRSLAQRRIYWSGEFGADTVETVPRSKICATEVYIECLNGDIKYMKRQDAMEINTVITKTPGWVKSEKSIRFGCHGVGKGFIKL